VCHPDADLNTGIQPFFWSLSPENSAFIFFIFIPLPIFQALFKKFEDGKIEENIFISPSSIYHTLMLTYFGSQGATEAELAEGLGFGNLSKSEVLKTYMFDRAYQVGRLWFL
jgi:serine protease inhibitor